MLLSAGVAALILEQRQSGFGESYAAELHKLRSELTIKTIDFAGDQSYVEFEVSLKSTPDAVSSDYLTSLAFDVKKVYCTQIASNRDDLKIDLFHVNVRAVSDTQSKIILSHPLSKKSCT